MWRRLNKPELGLMNTFSERIWMMEQKRPGNFPQFKADDPLYVFSDYSGAHGESRFDAYSFLLVQPGDLTNWDQQRTAIRTVCNMRDRRMAYKGLNDKIKANALPYWLEAFDGLPGLLATVLIDKSLGSLFPAKAVQTLKQDHPEYAALKPQTVERTFRICHFLSVLIAGLSLPGQNLTWVSDQDEIAANDSRLRLFTTTFGLVCSNYLEHNLGHFRFGTTALDDGSLQMEDLTSLPDIVAGAISEVQTLQLASNAMPVGHTLVPLTASLSLKARLIVNWLTSPENLLRRRIFAFWPAGDGKMFVNDIKFYDNPEPHAK